MALDIKTGLRFMTDIEVESLPPIPWLIKDILPAGALSILCGDAGTGKSFLALDWALSIATGNSWQGKDVHRGPVAYIAAEGIAGLGKRIRAWKQEHHIEGQTATGLYVLGTSVQLLMSGSINDLIAALLQLNEKPVLLVVDTLARCMVGGEENGSKDMGAIIQATEAIRSTFQAEGLADPQHFPMHIIFIHHTPKGGKGPRGHSSLRGAADVVIELSKRSKTKEGVGVKVVCDKQKDADAFDPIHLRLKTIPLDTISQDTSCILVPDTSVDNQNNQISRKRKGSKLYERGDKVTGDVLLARV